jgi:exodeoxyribonuclease VII small subunit
MDVSNMDENLTYEKAMEELEQIVSKIEEGKMNVDFLAENLKRAKDLVAFCKKKLTSVDDEVSKIFEDEN